MDRARGDGPLVVIGRKERVEFPDWGGLRVRAKVDTGAYSSALDVLGYDLLDDGRTARLRIAVRRRPARQIIVLAPLVGHVKVRSSAGRAECRPLIEPTVRLGAISFPLRLTVTCRAAMRCRMILGRQALAGRFVVDVQHRYLL